MKCPHCADSFSEQWTTKTLVSNLSARYAKCPSCREYAVEFRTATRAPYRMIHPAVPVAWKFTDAVPKAIAADIDEAAAVLPVSPKASAALSRRLLQEVLRDYAKTQERDLARQIEEVLPTLPSYLADAIDGVRVLGNFGAHPIKSKETGVIAEVEPGEAEWLLQTVAEAIDHYIVRPGALADRRNALNVKLKQFGKPPLKG